MNYDIYIENLGAIKEANITITPLTILAGENGTGKSFVTKFLYSVLNTMNIDVYSDYTIKLIKRLNMSIFRISHFFREAETDIDNMAILKPLSSIQKDLRDIIDIIDQNEMSYYELDDDLISKFQNILVEYNENILPNLGNVIEKIQNDLNNDSSEELLISTNIILGGLRNPKRLSDRVSTLLIELVDLLSNPQSKYIKLLSDYITDELKENFQISEIQHLINYSTSNSVFRVENLIEVSISKEEGLNVQLQAEYLSGFERINHILFFESPVYWRLLPVIDNLDKPRYRSLTNRKGYEVLTGIPKHFYDLKDLLFTNFKEGERPQFIRDCADDLEKHLKGSFKSSEADLTFENINGQSIPKNLVSFGMTNIGIIQAVLSKNIVNRGSFLFIDEPESNLHPEWQSVLSEVLVKLASNNVNIIITTHSSDMLKALEINAENNLNFELGSLISTSYFNGDGKLLDLEGSSSFEKIASARAELLKPYNALSIKKSLFND